MSNHENPDFKNDLAENSNYHNRILDLMLEMTNWQEYDKTKAEKLALAYLESNVKILPSMKGTFEPVLLEDGTEIDPTDLDIKNTTEWLKNKQYSLAFKYMSEGMAEPDRTAFERFSVVLSNNKEI